MAPLDICQEYLLNGVWVFFLFCFICLFGYFKKYVDFDEWANGSISDYLKNILSFHVEVCSVSFAREL